MCVCVKVTQFAVNLVHPRMQALLTGFDYKTVTMCLETVSENEEKRREKDGREKDGRNFHSAVWLYKREEK